MYKPCWVYMIECRGGGIYVGIAQDVEARYQQHMEGKGALYTRINPPERILAQVHCGSRAQAAEIERSLKKMSAADKWRWATAFSGSPDIRDLTDLVVGFLTKNVDHRRAGGKKGQAR